MGADKNAILENAQLFAARGQFDKAIAEWKKLTDGTPADGAIYNTIGDLHLKRNVPADAIDAYFKAAAAFREGEAALKAIALYKKILKVDPTRAEAYRCLAALNAERGLIGNAVSDYLILAKLCLRGDKGQEALEIYRTVATLDPSNLEVQQRIAELAPAGYRDVGSQDQTRTGLVAEPAGQPSRIKKEDSPQSSHRDRSESLSSEPPGLRLTQRGGASQPHPVSGGPAPPESSQVQGLPKWKPEWGRQDFINEAVRLTADGRYAEAESLLLELLDREPGDPEVCRLLAILHLRSGQLIAAKAEFRFLAEAAIRAQDFKLAESMLLECLKTVQDSVPLIELLGRVYEQVGNVESASSQYGRALEVFLEQPDPDQANLPLELYERIKAIAPSSPLVARFAHVCGSVPVRRDPEKANPVVPAFKFVETHHERQAEPLPGQQATSGEQAETLEIATAVDMTEVPSRSGGSPPEEPSAPERKKRRISYL